MSDKPVNNREIVIKPVNGLNVDIGESNLFSKQVDTNLWETAAKLIIPAKIDKKSIQYQIFKATQETQYYEEAMPKPTLNNLDFTC